MIQLNKSSRQGATKSLTVRDAEQSGLFVSCWKWNTGVCIATVRIGICRHSNEESTSGKSSIALGIVPKQLGGLFAERQFLVQYLKVVATLCVP